MTTDVEALIGDLVRMCMRAAEALRSQTERIQALEAKCALLAASLAQAENEVENLKYDIDRYMRIVNEEVARGDALLGALQLLAEVYDAMGAPRGPARIKADATIAAQAGSKEG